MSRSKRNAVLGAIVFAVVGLAPATHAAQADEWEWMVAPYAWIPSISTDLNTRIPPGDSGPDFSNLIDDIDGAFEMHVEGQGERFGMFADFTYLGLADSKSFARVDTNSDLDSILFEAAGVWSPGEGRLKGLELFGGLRYIDVELKVRFDPVNPVFNTLEASVDKSYSDFMLGGRYTWPVGERWRFTLRGDGSFGDTDGTWNVSGVGQYRVKYGSWLFGYRYLSVELEDGINDVDLTIHGPMVGFGFIF
jgi:hypothetical protein